MINYADRYNNLTADKKALFTLRLDKLAPRDTTSAANDVADKRIVAYIVWKQGVTSQTGELRNFIKGHLPEYMLPSAYVEMDALPLSPNGKVDRKLLPAPDGARPELEQAFVAPRNEVEQTLANIWAEVLRLDQIGINDNFFDLGGHSLLATQVISRVQVAFNVELPLRAIFENPTVAGLGMALVQAQADMAGDAELLRMLEELEHLSEDEADSELSN
ncbi:MAG TPA: phosphopantetheine-binding protein [Pyrinomonadaceae bacterium]